MKVAIGIDVGGTSIKFGLFSREGELLGKSSMPTEVENGAFVTFDRMRDRVHRIIDDSTVEAADLVGVGIGVPGPVREENFVPHCVNLQWKEVAVATEMQRRLRVPVRVENDANVAALGESWQGIGRGLKNLVLITLGTGVGGGIIANGHILSGAHGAGGEIGHMPLLERPLARRCNCGGNTCLELVCSATGIVARTQEKLREDSAAAASCILQRKSGWDAKTVFEVAAAGDALAVEIVRETGTYLGRACALIASVCDPELFAIGGGVSAAGDLLLEPTRRAYRACAFSACVETPLQIAALGNDAGIYGAARLALQAAEEKEGAETC
uniref:ROK family glucokinase n=1 Tax=Ndongobacter massiliensis TaxID=1871025 RepID=UPI00093149CA|nr:ROK family glucokinase [Ndongobacter massiliensis]